MDHDDDQFAAAAHFADVWAGVLPDLPDDYDCHMNCTEAEAAADFLTAFGHVADGIALMAAHARYDKPGDAHHHF